MMMMRNRNSCMRRNAFLECWVQRVFHDDFWFEWVCGLEKTEESDID